MAKAAASAAAARGRSRARDPRACWRRQQQLRRTIASSYNAMLVLEAPPRDTITSRTHDCEHAHNYEDEYDYEDEYCANPEP